MSSFVYQKGIVELDGGGDIDYTNDTIKVMLVSSDYSPDAELHQSLADVSGEVSGGGYTAGGKTLSSKQVSGSEPTCYLAGELIWTILNVVNVRYALVYKDSGSPGTSWLIACMDLDHEYDLAGQDLIIAWNAGMVLYTGEPDIFSFTKRIAADADDGSSTPTAFFNDMVRIGKQSASTNAFLRFPEVTIPQGAGILAAKVTLRANGSTSGSITRCNICCNDEDDAAAPLNRIEHSAKTRTSVFTAWDGIGAWVADNDYESPDFSDVVQEVIDRPGWLSGNALMVLIDDDGSDGSSQRVAYDYSASAEHCALLSVTYTINVSGVEPPVVGVHDTRIRLHARKRRTLLTTKVRNV